MSLFFILRNLLITGKVPEIGITKAIFFLSKYLFKRISETIQWFIFCHFLNMTKSHQFALEFVLTCLYYTTPINFVVIFPLQYHTLQPQQLEASCESELSYYFLINKIFIRLSIIGRKKSQSILYLLIISLV